MIDEREPRRLNDDGIGFWFEPGDGSERIRLGDLVGSDIRPGDTVELYPVTGDGATKGYVVVHRPDRDEPELVRGALADVTDTVVPPSQLRPQIEIERARLREKYGRLLAAVEREEAAVVRRANDAAGQVLDLALRGETYVEIPYPADMEPPKIYEEESLVAGTTADDDDDESDDDEPEIGPVERALRADLRRLKPTTQLARTLIASALTLARAMDNAPADKIASIGKELREHVKRIEESAGADDDTRDHTVNLSTPI